MAYTEKQYTQAIESLSGNIVAILDDKEDPRPLIDELLKAPEGMLATYDSINARYRALGHQGNLIDIPPTAVLSDFERDKLDYICRLHLIAIRDGYKLTQIEQSRSRHAKNTVNIFHHHAHYTNCWGSHNSLLHDYLIWSMIFNSGPRGSTHTSSSRDGKGMNAGQALLLIGLVLAAAGAAFYTAVHMRHLVDELIHGERVPDNMAKLGVVSLAATSGAFIGIYIGASAFAMPALGAVLTAIILGGAAFALSNYIHQTFLQQSKFTHSAIEGDSRFTLSRRDWNRVLQNGLNPYVVEEVIRELAIEYSHVKTNSMHFWGKGSKSRADILKTVRELKSGEFPNDTIIVGRKFYSLKSNYFQDSQVELPIARYQQIPSIDSISSVRTEGQRFTKNTINYRSEYDEDNNNANPYEAYFIKAH